jgi:hypothetical protein
MTAQWSGPISKPDVQALFLKLADRGSVAERILYHELYAASFFAGNYDVSRGWPIVQAWLGEVGCCQTHGKDKTWHPRPA